MAYIQGRHIAEVQGRIADIQGHPIQVYELLVTTVTEAWLHRSDLGWISFYVCKISHLQALNDINIRLYWVNQTSGLLITLVVLQRTMRIFPCNTVHIYFEILHINIE